jgi:hypothetical protein
MSQNLKRTLQTRSVTDSNDTKVYFELQMQFLKKEQQLHSKYIQNSYLTYNRENRHTT